MEDPFYFDPTHLYKAFMSSNIATNMHFGMAEYCDFPTELYHSRCWASSIRTILPTKASTVPRLNVVVETIQSLGQYLHRGVYSRLFNPSTISSRSQRKSLQL
jgi:hypothetical protein